MKNIPTSQLLGLGGYILCSTTFFYVGAKFDPCQGRKAGTFASNPKACDKFYYCNQNGTAVPVFCPEGMLFSYQKGICDVPNHVDCVVEDKTPQTPAEEIFCPKSIRDIIFIPSKIDCHKYYLCYHGKPVEQQCIPELHWNEELNKCDFPENSKCLATPNIPRCPPNGRKLLSHPGKCSYFIYCVNGHSSVQQCPFYHHWDKKKKKCVWRTMAHCVEKDT